MDQYISLVGMQVQVRDADNKMAAAAVLAK